MRKRISGTSTSTTSRADGPYRCLSPFRRSAFCMESPLSGSLDGELDFGDVFGVVLGFAAPQVNLTVRAGSAVAVGFYPPGERRGGPADRCKGAVVDRARHRLHRWQRVLLDAPVFGQRGVGGERCLAVYVPLPELRVVPDGDPGPGGDAVALRVAPQPSEEPAHGGVGRERFPDGGRPHRFDRLRDHLVP